MALAILALASAATATALLVAIRLTSNQRRIRLVKRGIRAGLFEIRLRNDNLRAIVRACRSIFQHNLIYLRLSAVPMLWAALPLAVLLTQLHFFYGYAPLAAGRSTVVTASFPTGIERPTDLLLETPDGIRVDSPAVWTPSRAEAAWRVVAERDGEFVVAITASGQVATKSVRVDGGYARLSPVRFDRRTWTRWFSSAEAALPADSLVRSIAIDYPPRWLTVFGYSLHWLVAFTVLTLAFALVLKRRFRVEL